MDWYRVSNGGGTSSGNGCTIMGTIGQAEPGMVVADSVVVQSGFWSLEAGPPSPTGTGTSNDLMAVAYGHGTYVAVSYQGNIFTSLDGASWSAQTNYPSTPGSLNGIAYGNGMFVGVGVQAWIVTSTDGDNWTSTNTTATDVDLSAVAFGAGRFVAIGASGVIITSANGSHWSVADSGTTSDLEAIIWANGRFVVTGNESATSLTSTDGIHWTVGGDGLTDNTDGVCGGNGMFVAADWYGNLYTSSDGLNWVQQAACGLHLLSACFWDGLLVAAGENGTLFVSPDGTNWTQMQSLADENLNGLVGENVQFVVVGDGGTGLTVAMASLAVPAPLRWSVLASPVTSDLYSVVCNGQVYVAIGSDSDSSAVSTSGLDWTAPGAGLDNASFNGVSWGNGVFVAAESEGSIYTSTDGQNWAQQTDLGAPLNAIAFGSGAFVVAANKGEVFASSDGVQWKPHTTGLVEDLMGICYGNGLFVVVAWDGTIASSADGKKWTLSANQPSTMSELFGVGYGNKQFVAVGESGMIETSPDATEWTLQTNYAVAASLLRSVAWGDDEFVAVGDGGWTVRGNGSDWTSSSSATVNDLYSVIFTNGSFVAVGDNGTIMVTPRSAVPFLLSAAFLANGSLQLTLRGTPGSTYAIEASTDLIHWSQLASLTLTSAAGQSVDSSASRVAGARFYRAKLSP
ncbi:MAG: hypothetical protein ACLQVY_06280 [Limisphaerales bacterium]